MIDFKKNLSLYRTKTRQKDRHYDFFSIDLFEVAGVSGRKTEHNGSRNDKHKKAVS